MAHGARKEAVSTRHMRIQCCRAYRHTQRELGHRYGGAIRGGGAKSRVLPGSGVRGVGAFVKRHGAGAVPRLSARNAVYRQQNMLRRRQRMVMEYCAKCPPIRRVVRKAAVVRCIAVQE